MNLDPSPAPVEWSFALPCGWFRPIWHPPRDPPFDGASRYRIPAPSALHPTILPQARKEHPKFPDRVQPSGGPFCPASFFRPPFAEAVICLVSSVSPIRTTLRPTGGLGPECSDAPRSITPESDSPSHRSLDPVPRLAKGCRRVPDVPVAAGARGIRVLPAGNPRSRSSAGQSSAFLKRWSAVRIGPGPAR